MIPRRAIAAGFVTAALVFLACDAVWLTFAGARLYQPDIGAMLAGRPRLGAAAAFYAIYLAGMTFFCIMPALAGGGVRAALFRGAAFGFVAYATYDLTNQATLMIWTTRVTVFDLMWGAAVTAAASACGAAAGRRFT